MFSWFKGDRVKRGMPMVEARAKQKVSPKQKDPSLNLRPNHPRKGFASFAIN